MSEVTGTTRHRSREKGSTRFLASMDWNTTELFRSTEGEPFISIKQVSGGRLDWPIRSAETRHYIRNRYYELTSGTAMPKHTFEEVVETLEGQACSGQSAAEEVHVRVAHHAGETFVDLGRADAKVVRINKNGWSLTFDCPVRFVRPAGFGELPEPARGGKLSRLKDLFGLGGDNWVLISSFILNIFGPGPYFALLIEGEQGSGKSTLCVLIKRLVDPVIPEKSRLPRGTHELMIEAARNRLLVFDNTSSMKNDISDALCSLSSGGGFVTRRLYSNRDACIFHYSRPFIMNGIGEFANRPDLLDRCIAVQLPAMGAENRRTEGELFREFEEMRPELLGSIFDAVAQALSRMTEAIVPPQIRNADAAQWIVAGETALGSAEGSFVQTFAKMQTEMLADRALADPLVLALIKQLEWKQGMAIVETLGDLLVMLRGDDQQYDRHLPATPRRLSNDLRRLRPAMAAIGISVEFLHRTNKGRIVRIMWGADDVRRLFGRDEVARSLATGHLDGADDLEHFLGRDEVAQGPK